MVHCRLHRMCVRVNMCRMGRVVRMFFVVGVVHERGD